MRSNAVNVLYILLAVEFAGHANMLIQALNAVAVDQEGIILLKMERAPYANWLHSQIVHL